MSFKVSPLARSLGVICFGILLSGVTTPVFSGDAAGDRCVDAPLVTVGSYTGTTLEASSDGSASCGRSADSPDAWFAFDAPTQGRLVASTCDTDDYDTVLSLHEACPGDTDNQRACNDDACGLSSSVSADLEEGDRLWIRVSGYNSASGEFQLDITFTDLSNLQGADLVSTDVFDMSQRGRLGSEVAFSMASVICNIGDTPLDWFSNPDPRHPFLVFNMYRLFENRLVQIGQSGAKHGFSASQGGGCGIDCTPFGSNQYLGVGCSDIYGVGTNANQRSIGPRIEVNSWTGEYDFATSFINTNDGNFTPVENRLRVHDDDLDPATYPGATYFAELYVIAYDDDIHTNNIGHKQVVVTGSPGGTWSTDLASGESQIGVVQQAWPGSETSVIHGPLSDEGELVGDGRLYCSVRVSDSGDGTWHYEYAVFNLDVERGVHEFRLPVAAGVEVTNPGFYAVRSHDEGFSNEAWQFVREGDEIRWETGAHGDAGPRNPLRWGTLYNFWFDADVAPEEVTAKFGLYREPETTLTGTTRGPGEPDEPLVEIFRRGDSDSDGETTLADAIVTLSFLFNAGTTPSCLDAADSDDSGFLDISDSVIVLLWLFSGGAVPADPGPLQCGPDPVQEDPAFPDCVYPRETCAL